MGLLSGDKLKYEERHLSYLSCRLDDCLQDIYYTQNDFSSSNLRKSASKMLDFKQSEANMESHSFILCQVSALNHSTSCVKHTNWFVIEITTKGYLKKTLCFCRPRSQRKFKRKLKLQDKNKNLQLLLSNTLFSETPSSLFWWKFQVFSIEQENKSDQKRSERLEEKGLRSVWETTWQISS